MRVALVVGAFFAAALAGCGEDSGSSSTAPAGGGQLVVSAASSLEPAFTAYAEQAGYDAKQSFAGSDDLAAQIRQGVTPDVYAAANTSLPDDLYKDGLVEKPVVFATNTLVLAVPAGSDIDSLDDLTGDVTLAIGDEGVPVGDYTREVLDRLPAEESGAILDNVRSLEPDVAGIVGKLTQGAVDAGFVYTTDVVATDGALEAIDAARRPPARRRVRSGGRRRRRESRRGAGVHRRAARRRRRRGPRATPASARRRRTERDGPTRPVHRRAGRRARARARLPDHPRCRDLRQHGAGRPHRQPRERGVARGALAEPEDDPGGAGRDRRRRHPGRLPARDPRVPRQGGGRRPRSSCRSSCPPPSPGSACSPRSGRRGSSARRSTTPGSSSSCRPPA